jgi:pteridine reductase
MAEASMSDDRTATPFANRVALVTGGAHRVGRAIVDSLAARRMRIAVHYHGSDAAARTTVDQLRADGVDAHAFQADLRDTSAVTQLVADVVAHFGALDVLVNSAAIMQRTPVGQVIAAQWDNMFALNVRAPFFLSQAACPHLARAHGAIVNIADLAAFETWSAYVPHSMTKASIVQMTRGLAHALAPNVRVNAVAPGTVLLPDDWDSDAAQHLIKTTPLKRLGDPRDVAHAVTYLLDADYVTGEVIIVDGGRHVRK